MSPSPQPRSLAAASQPDDLDQLPAQGVQPHDHVVAALVQGWLRAYAATRDPRLRERIILAYLGLADRLAGRYVRSQGVTLDDMRQAARVGLVAAVDRYDPTRGTSFVPYAVACVRGELKRYLRDTTWTLRIARPLKERSLAVCRALDELPSRLGREPTIAEVAEHLDACPQEVVEAIGAARTRSQLSVDQALQPDGETTLGELLADAGPREELEDLLVLRELVNQLPERERRVIHLTYVGELTQDEIARGMGCSQMLVSRLLRRGVDRLRRQLLAPDGESEAQVPPSACPPSSGGARRRRGRPTAPPGIAWEARGAGGVGHGRADQPAGQPPVVPAYIGGETVSVCRLPGCLPALLPGPLQRSPLARVPGIGFRWRAVVPVAHLLAAGTRATPSTAWRRSRLPTSQPGNKSRKGRRRWRALWEAAPGVHGQLTSCRAAHLQRGAATCWRPRGARAADHRRVSWCLSSGWRDPVLFGRGRRAGPADCCTANHEERSAAGQPPCCGPGSCSWPVVP